MSGKKKEETQKSTRTSKVKIASKKKSDYKEQKKVRNRLAWIEKRFTTIENKIEKERALTNNPDYNDKYEILEDALNNMNTLEKEYLELMEEQERLLK
jgi:hypothetical protein